jgi:hypothetical protein
MGPARNLEAPDDTHPPGRRLRPIVTSPPPKLFEDLTEGEVVVYVERIADELLSPGFSPAASGHRGDE